MKIFGWIVAIPFMLLIVWIIGRLLFCGPDEGIRKVTDPLANSILEHVNKNGKPESLLSIRTLPYEMQKCKKFEKIGRSSREFSEEESCIFKLGKKSYSVTIDHLTNNENKNKRIYTFGLDIYDNKENTWIHYYFGQKKINSFEKELKLSKSYCKNIKVPYLCQSGYLSIK